MPVTAPDSQPADSAPADSQAPDAEAEAELEPVDTQELTSFIVEAGLEQLAQLSPEEVGNLLADLERAELTDEQAEQIAVALSAAPESLKLAFEAQINVFGGQFDAYVPVGSTVDVGTRRTLVAATAAATVLPGPAAVGKRK